MADACVCLEVLDAVAEKNEGKLTIDGICKEKNGVFSAELERPQIDFFIGNIKKILQARPVMKTITLNEDGQICIRK